jgi:gamma-glutamyltranspeptidase / glutathione hydrolase
MKASPLTLIVALPVLGSGCGVDEPPSDRAGNQDREELTAKVAVAEQFMVTAAHPLAVRAGVEILREGGSAIDAAVAVQMVLSVVEPPETGIGGGGFLMYQDQLSGLHFYDGREVGPASTEADQFTMLGRPMPLPVAMVSGRAVGVPGLLAMLELAHQRHGRLPWATLFEHAIRHANDGIDMPPRLADQIRQDWTLRLFTDTRRHFVRQGRSSSPRLVNPELGRALQAIAAEGAAGFYEGETGTAFVARARARWPLRSRMTTADLTAYEAVEREPLCGRYREWTLCGPPPPSSAGIALLQMLGMLEHFPLAELGPDSATAIHLMAEASRLAFADRNRYVGDPAFSDVPVNGLIDADYLRSRASLIDDARAMRQADPGLPPGIGTEVVAGTPAEDETFGTTHFSVVDAQGNVAALTSSNESPFGTRMMVSGIIVNNQLTDFTFDPRMPDGSLHPNAPAAGKRPRSSMAPIIVLDADGNTRLVIGSRGGARIIGYVLKVLIGVLDWGKTLEEAIAMPNFLHRGIALELEAGSAVTRHRRALESLGHDVSVTTLTSGLHGIERIDTGWRGAADPRLDGTAAGD